MQDHYKLLLTIYDIVKNDPQPEHYGCRPRELILRQLQEWPVIYQCLQLLEQEELIRMQQQDTLVIRITPEGLEQAKMVNKRVRESN
jgi:hypothetical protein